LRTLRKAATGAVALGTAAAFIVPAVTASPAVAAGPTTATPIQHLVVIFQENVSYDHYFGTYPSATNTDGTTFTPVATPGNNNLQGHTPDLTTAGGNPNAVAPVRYANSATSASGPRSLLTCDQDHNYADEQTAFDGGSMDKFPSSVGSSSANEVDGLACSKNEVMNYYDGNTVTGLWNYAQKFAMSDSSFGTTFGPSAPGAVNLVSGDTGNVDTTGCTGLALSPPTAAGCTHMASSLNFGPTNTATMTIATRTSPNADTTLDGTGGLSLTSDAQPFYDDCSTRDAVALTGTNVGDELSAAGVSWGWFQGGFRPSTPYSTANAAGTNHPTSTFVPDEFSGKYNVNTPKATALGGGTTPLNQGICNAWHNIGADLPAPNTGTGQWGSKGDYIAHHEPFEYYGSTANPHHLPPASLSVIGTDTQSFSGGSYKTGTPNWDTANHQYDTSDFDSLVAAAAQGQNNPGSADGKYHLPAVSFLKAGGWEDGHAQYSDPIDEQNFITREINALMQTPDWSSTAVVINYDDSDGWYDHSYATIASGSAAVGEPGTTAAIPGTGVALQHSLVPINPSNSAGDNLFSTVSGPPYAAPGVSQLCYAPSQGNASTALASQMGRCGLGPRLPMMAISCFARSNYIDHAVSDQASVTKFIQGNWGLASISGSFANLPFNSTASNATYNAEGPLSNLFDFTAGANDVAGCNPYYLDVHTGAVTSVPNPQLPDSRIPALFAVSGAGVIVGFVLVRRRRSRRAA
jgi:phospholipase C